MSDARFKIGDVVLYATDPIRPVHSDIGIIDEIHLPVGREDDPTYSLRSVHNSRLGWFHGDWLKMAAGGTGGTGGIAKFSVTPNAAMRVFESGATRDNDTEKIDFEGFLSPLALEAFAQYMHKNRIQADGSMRDSDNWQKGMPKSVYVKSMWRHFFAVWKNYRQDKSCTEDLCALFFNVQGLLHVLETERLTPEKVGKPIQGMEEKKS